MTEQPTESPPQPLQQCKRCNENPSVINLRTEHLCSTCFSKYLHSKCIKRLEPFRVRYNPPTSPNNPPPPRRLLLPISFGISSTTLLHVLDTHLKNQRRRAISGGRTGSTLVVLYIDERTIDPSVPHPDNILALRDRFPGEGGEDGGGYEYVSVPLEEIYTFQDAARAFEPHSSSSSSSSGDNTAKLRHLLGSLPTTSSRMDMLQILRTRLVAALARRYGCLAVLYGDTATRLAEKTLAETAKGRGFAVPWMTADSEDSPYGVGVYYPLRDLLKKEVVTYVCLPPGAHGAPLEALCVGWEPRPRYAPAGKGVTVDELVTGYFAAVEEKYPAVVANVVRTAGKLVVGGGGVVRLGRCRICGLPKDGGGGELVLAAEARDGRVGGGGGEDGKVKKDRPGSDMCYGCARSVHGAEPYEWPLN